jgi:hypothetical protein
MGLETLDACLPLGTNHARPPRRLARSKGFTMRAWIIGLALAMTGWAAGQFCPPNGMVLSTAGGRLGDPFSLSLSGTPKLILLGALKIAIE